MTDAASFSLDNAAEPVTRIHYTQARMEVLALRGSVDGARDKDSAREWVRGFGLALVRYSFSLRLAAMLNDPFSLFRRTSATLV